MAAAMQHALRGEQQMPWPARSSDLSTTEQVWDMMKRELTLPPEPATTTAKLQQWEQDAWDNLLQDDIWQLFYRLHAGMHACVATRVECIVYCLGTPYCDIHRLVFLVLAPML